MQVGLRLAKLLSPKHTVTSIIRDPAQADDIEKVSATPVVLSIEDDSQSAFTQAFKDAAADVVVWSAGAGGKGGAERTEKVDYEGAVKVFDAIEAINGKVPRLLLVSAIDVRNPDKIPAHYVCPPSTRVKVRIKSTKSTYGRMKKTLHFRSACAK